MIRRTSQISKVKTPLILAVCLVALGGAGYLAIRHYHKPVASQAPAGVNLNPATEQEKKESEDIKNQSAGQSQTPSTQTTAGKKQVSVVVTNASSDSVNAYVTGVFEEGGVCTATFTQGSTTITRTSTGFRNVSYTQCAPISSNLPNSSPWSVIVSYSSATAEGKSQPQTL